MAAITLVRESIVFAVDLMFSEVGTLKILPLGAALPHPRYGVRIAPSLVEITLISPIYQRESGLTCSRPAVDLVMDYRLPFTRNLLYVPSDHSVKLRPSSPPIDSELDTLLGGPSITWSKLTRSWILSSHWRN